MIILYNRLKLEALPTKCKLVQLTENTPNSSKKKNELEKILYESSMVPNTCN